MGLRDHELNNEKPAIPARHQYTGYQYPTYPYPKTTLKQNTIYDDETGHYYPETEKKENVKITIPIDTAEIPAHILGKFDYEKEEEYATELALEKLDTIVTQEYLKKHHITTICDYFINTINVIIELTPTKK